MGGNDTTVTVGVFAISLATILIWIFEAGSGVVIPSPVQGAITAFITGCLQWYLPKGDA